MEPTRKTARPAQRARGLARGATVSMLGNLLLAAFSAFAAHDSFPDPIETSFWYWSIGAVLAAFTALLLMQAARSALDGSGEQLDLVIGAFSVLGLVVAGLSVLPTHQLVLAVYPAFMVGLNLAVYLGVRALRRQQSTGSPADRSETPTR